MLNTLISASVLASGEAGGHEELAPVIAEPLVVGAVIFGIMIILMFITVSYSNLGRRHEVVEEHADPHRQHPNKHDQGSQSH